MHSAQRVSTLVCILAGALLAAPAQARIVAVAVGIDDYDSPQITPLRAAVSDATAFANALCDHCGAAAADVKVLTTATSEYHSRPTKANIIMHLKWAERAIAPDDTLVFFFAGHGINRWGKSYILPVDANTTDADLVALTSLAVEDLNNVLAGIQCAHQVIIMDCCRNDPDQGRGDGANAATESLVRDVQVLGQTGHSRAGAQTSTVLFSCMSGQRAYECPDGRHGVFTHFLLQGLAGAAGRGGQVTLGDICDYVEQEVPTYVKLAVGLREDAAQNPWHKSEGSGQVLLARATPVAPATEMPDMTMTISHLGNRGPEFKPGVTPSALGWGADASAYPGRFVVNPVDLAEMVWVPPGRFMMGSTQDEIDVLWDENGWDPGWLRNAGDEHCHAIGITQGVWAYRHEVTNGQYARFLAATGHALPTQWDRFQTRPQLPVIYVSWGDAQAYSAWAGGALPSEAQWEYAARGPMSSIFTWGQRWDPDRCVSAEYWADECITDDNVWADWAASIGGQLVDGRWAMSWDLIADHMVPVGSVEADQSWCGARDLAGNVWEWCADWYAEDYYVRSPRTDPPGPELGTARVTRGGSWYNGPTACRSADRNKAAPTLMWRAGGFRPVILCDGRDDGM